MSSLDHIKYLAETIGPRGPTTEEEVKAADYVADQLTFLGLASERQRFLSAVSTYMPYVICTGLALLGLVLFWQPQPVGAMGAFILTGIAFVSLLLELSSRPNPVRWCLPIEDSQNVFVTIPCSAMQASTEGAQPAGACKQTIVLTAHLDTQHTPLVYRSPGWLKLFQLLLTVAAPAIAVLLVLFAIGVYLPAPVLRQIALAPGLVVLLIFLLLIRAEFTPVTRGADDNASGVAIALGLAGRLTQTPLNHTKVIIAFTGCEEVGGYGTDALIESHRAELRDAILLVINRVGGVGTHPCVIHAEPFLLPALSDPQLLKMADDIKALQPELGVTTHAMSITCDSLSIGAKHHLRAIAISSLSKDGTAPNGRTASDVLTDVDESVLERSQEFAWLLLQAIDAAAKK